MSQTSYSLTPTAGFAGNPYDASGTWDQSSDPAAEEIPFGRLVERQTDGTLRLWRGTGKAYGVSMRHPARETGTFAVGGSATYKQYEQVPVMRRGRIWAAYESNAAGVALAAADVWGPSDDTLSNAAKRGTYTSRATSATAGAEVYAAASTLFWRAIASTDTVCVVEVSFS